MNPSFCPHEKETAYQKRDNCACDNFASVLTDYSTVVFVLGHPVTANARFRAAYRHRTPAWHREKVPARLSRGPVLHGASRAPLAPGVRGHRPPWPRPAGPVESRGTCSGVVRAKTDSGRHSALRRNQGAPPRKKDSLSSPRNPCPHPQRRQCTVCTAGGAHGWGGPRPQPHLLVRGSCASPAHQRRYLCARSLCWDPGEEVRALRLA